MSPNFLIAEVQMATIARVTKNMYNVFKFIYMYMKLLRKVQGMLKLSNYTLNWNHWFVIPINLTAQK